MKSFFHFLQNLFFFVFFSSKKKIISGKQKRKRISTMTDSMRPTIDPQSSSLFDECMNDYHNKDNQDYFSAMKDSDNVFHDFHSIKHDNNHNHNNNNNNFESVLLQHHMTLANATSEMPQPPLIDEQEQNEQNEQNQQIEEIEEIEQEKGEKKGENKTNENEMMMTHEYPIFQQQQHQQQLQKQQQQPLPNSNVVYRDFQMLTALVSEGQRQNNQLCAQFQQFQQAAGMMFRELNNNVSQNTYELESLKSEVVQLKNNMSGPKRAFNGDATSHYIWKIIGAWDDEILPHWNGKWGGSLYTRNISRDENTGEITEESITVSGLLVWRAITFLNLKKKITKNNVDTALKLFSSTCEHKNYSQHDVMPLPVNGGANSPTYHVFMPAHFDEVCNTAKEVPMPSNQWPLKLGSTMEIPPHESKLFECPFNVLTPNGLFPAAEVDDPEKNIVCSAPRAKTVKYLCFDWTREVWRRDGDEELYDYYCSELRRRFAAMQCECSTDDERKSLFYRLGYAKAYTNGKIKLDTPQRGRYSGKRRASSQNQNTRTTINVSELNVSELLLNKNKKKRKNKK